MEIKSLPIQQLKAWALNPRKHEVGRIVKSIEKFGFRAPLVVNEKDGQYIIEAGHGRLEAARKLGIKELPCIVVEDDEHTAQAYAIADNRMSDLSDWDMPSLKNILEELDAHNLDMEAIGWNGKELEDLFTRLSLPELWRADDWAGHDNIEELTGYDLSSFWGEKSKTGGQAFPYMLELPPRPRSSGATVAGKWSRTNSEAVERVIRTYMRPGDVFYEMCSGWVTFASTAKFWGFSGKASDIWDTALDFDKKQIAKMPGQGSVEIVKADCRDTGELSNTYDFVHSNPPFFSLEKYSDNPDDLSRLSSYDKWLSAMVDMAKETERILKPSGLANFVLNDYRHKGFLINMHADFITAVLKGTNLKMWDMVVSEVISQSLRFRKREYENRRTVKCHEYIMTFKKMA